MSSTRSPSLGPSTAGAPPAADTSGAGAGAGTPSTGGGISAAQWASLTDVDRNEARNNPFYQGPAGAGGSGRSLGLGGGVGLGGTASGYDSDFFERPSTPGAALSSSPSAGGRWLTPAIGRAAALVAAAAGSPGTPVAEVGAMTSPAPNVAAPLLATATDDAEVDEASEEVVSAFGPAAHALDEEIPIPGESFVMGNLKAYYRDDQSNRIDGTLAGTNYRLIFTPDRGQVPPSMQHLPRSYFQVPLMTIRKIAQVPIKGVADPVLMLHCKDFRVMQFGLHEDSRRCYEVIKQYAFPMKIQHVFAFYHRPSRQAASSQPDAGWKIYDFETEMNRLGVFQVLDTSERPAWRVYNNSDFTLSPTYPAQFVVPRQCSDADLFATAQFRSKGRIPALTWHHIASHGTLWRSSQPRVGVGGNECTQDEAMLRYIRTAAAAGTGTTTRTMLVADCRPKTNAVANKAAGMGYTNYRNTTLTFLGIHNIHAVRDSLAKLAAIVNTAASPGSWLSGIEDTGWLGHIRSVLLGGARVASALVSGSPVLVHCSDGWDRTSQVTSLAQLMGDPYYRTIPGFCTLIAKDWLSFGHRFQLRVGHAEETETEDLSPIFLQFLDCVWQLVHQYPTRFEFGPRLLLTCADHIYTCRFGTFLYNCTQERLEERVAERTPSLFAHLLSRADEFRSPFYDPSAPDVLLPSVSSIIRGVTLWGDYYLRFSPCPSLPNSLTLTALAEARDRLEDLTDAMKSDEIVIGDIKLRVAAPCARLNICETDEAEYALWTAVRALRPQRKSPKQRRKRTKQGAVSPTKPKQAAAAPATPLGKSVSSTYIPAYVPQVVANGQELTGEDTEDDEEDQKVAPLTNGGTSSRPISDADDVTDDDAEDDSDSDDEHKRSASSSGDESSASNANEEQLHKLSSMLAASHAEKAKLQAALTEAQQYISRLTAALASANKQKGQASQQ